MYIEKLGLDEVIWSIRNVELVSYRVVEAKVNSDLELWNASPCLSAILPARIFSSVRM